MAKPFLFFKNEHPIDALQKNAARVIAYFDVFQYPLTIGEIEQYREPCTACREMNTVLDELLQRKVIFRSGDYYSLQDNPLLAFRRKEGNNRALPLLRRAMRIGRVLYRFPFVRAVAVSGSLSKDFASEKSDVDFFIITKCNRLWVARTFLHIYKKLAILLGKGRFYCMNYFIDENALSISERNYYTAIEMKTLVPVAGANVQEQLLKANEWVEDYLPYARYKMQQQNDPRSSLISRFIEVMLDNRLGDWLDDLLFRITSQRWQNKQKRGEKNGRGDVHCLITGKNFARSNAGNMQQRILAEYEERARQLLFKLRSESFSGN